MGNFFIASSLSSSLGSSLSGILFRIKQVIRFNTTGTQPEKEVLLRENIACLSETESGFKDPASTQGCCAWGQSRAARSLTSIGLARSSIKQGLRLYKSLWEAGDKEKQNVLKEHCAEQHVVLWRIKLAHGVQLPPNADFHQPHSVHSARGEQAGAGIGKHCCIQYWSNECLHAYQYVHVAQCPWPQHLDGMESRPCSLCLLNIYIRVICYTVICATALIMKTMLQDVTWSVLMNACVGTLFLQTGVYPSLRALWFPCMPSHCA